MKDYNLETSAFVGIAFSNDVIYNYVDQEGEFENTGMSIIRQLLDDKNYFMAQIMESQSYDNIKAILDDEVIFGPFYSTQNNNLDTFAEVYRLMEEDSVFDYYYVYDVVKDVIILKTPDINKPMALDYKNKEDVDYFLDYK